MNILHVVNSFDISGRSRLVHELSMGVKHQGHHAMIVSLTGRCRYRQHDVDWQCVHRRRGIDFAAAKRLKRIIERHSINIVHSHGRGAAVYAALAARMVPRVWMIHTVHRADGDRISRHRFVRRLTLANVDRVTAVSDAARERFCEVNEFPAKRSVTIHNGIDIERFQPKGGTPRNVCVDGRLTIGTIANLSHDKDVDTLLQAFAELLQVKKNAHLTVVGDGPCKKQAQKSVRNMGLLEQVTFTGFRVDIPELLGAFDIFAFSTRTEGFGLAILEAMAAGVPVAASRVGGVPEIVTDGVNGLLVEPGDSGALKDALLRIVDDSELRQSLIRNAHETIARSFTIKSMCDQYLDMYRSVQSE